MNLLKRCRNFMLALFGMRTLGVRILLVANQQILLVKHTYQSGWYTIGGAIERGESPLQAIQRELKEETGIELKEQPQLFAVYYSNFEGHDDYIVLYTAHHYALPNIDSPEILEAKWFPVNNLPADVTPATKRRIQEFLHHHPIADRW